MRKEKQDIPEEVAGQKVLERKASITKLC